MINESTARKYCKDDISKIENYEKAVNDITQKWEIHHRTEIWWNCTAKELIANDCYYHRKACELIFLTKAEHTRLHMKGKAFTAEHRQKISATMKVNHVPVNGKNNPMYGKHHSEASKAKMTDSHKGKSLSAEHRLKIAEAMKAYCVRRRQGGNE